MFCSLLVEKPGAKVLKQSLHVGIAARCVIKFPILNFFLDREKAIEMCRQLVERNFGHGVEKGKETEFKDDDSVYRLLEDDESTALNSGMSSVCEPRPAPEVAEELRRLILTLYSKFLSKDGRVSVIVFFMSQLALL